MEEETTEEIEMENRLEEEKERAQETSKSKSTRKVYKETWHRSEAKGMKI